MPRVPVIAVAIISVAGIFVVAMAGYSFFDFRETTSGVPVVVASRDIGAGTKISPEMIEIVNVPQAEAEPVAIIPIDLACQALTRVAIAEGEQVTYAKLQSCGYDGH